MWGGGGIRVFATKRNTGKVSQKDLDMVRIEMENIDSTEDKIWLMDKLYGHINAIDAQLKCLENPKSKDDIERKDELLRLQEDAQDIRRRILDRQLPSGHYGLFINYPKGYEG